MKRFFICIASLSFALYPVAVIALPAVRDASHPVKSAGKKTQRIGSKRTLNVGHKKVTTNPPPDSRTPISSDLSLSVQAILVPRKLNLQLTIRFGCVLSFLVFLVGCINTISMPRTHAIWALVADSVSTEAMPNDFIPSVVDCFLANVIATSTNELLPSIFMPSIQPLLGAFASIMAYIVLTILLPRWFTEVRVGLNYEKVGATAEEAACETNSKACVLVHLADDLAQHNLDNIDGGKKATVLCPLHLSPKVGSKKKKKKATSRKMLDSGFAHPCPFYFELNQCRVYFDPTTGKCVDGGPNLHMARIEDLEAASQQGLSKAQTIVAQDRYGPYNRPELASPTVREAFYARISSPLVVVQLIGRLLTVFEEGKASILNFGATILHHYWNARQAIHSAKQLAEEVQESIQDTSSMEVWVLRDAKKGKKWVQTTALDVFPGDVFIMTKANHHEDMVVPVDALLLSGQCLTNEAVLTGESVPQSKTAMDFVEERLQADSALDMRTHSYSILFAGTNMIHCALEASHGNLHSDLPVLPETASASVVCLALRTGTYSSKGELLRVLKSNSNVGAISNHQSEKDSMRLIAGMSACAVASCASIFVSRGLETREVSAFRRIIQCTRIAIASIPSDLPLALSAVARTCSYNLRQEADVVCSEPGSLLTAAHVDMVVFDKTGTLTADTQSLSKLVSKVSSLPAPISSSWQRFVLAGCHSLVHLNGTDVVGDPLDLAALRYSGWKYSMKDDCYELANTKKKASSDPVRLWKVKSFPFDSSKRLSSALVLAELADQSYRLLSLVKGSPETLQRHYGHRDNAAFMKSQKGKVQELEAQGYRTISLGFQDLTKSTDLVERLFPQGLSLSKLDLRKAREEGALLHRNDFEGTREDSDTHANFDFMGFACFDTAIRQSSSRVLNELRRGGIQPIMLTGDAIDAALAVSLKVGLLDEPSVALLEVDESADKKSPLLWRIVKLKAGKGGTRKALHKDAKNKSLTKSSARDILKLQRRGECAIAATGPAMELLFSDQENGISQGVKSVLSDNLFAVSIIARATPALKKTVIGSLKGHCGKKVVMCGDGVNDVAAMKTADVAVALLNGFGAEGADANDQIDTDNERRKQKLANNIIGSNRQNSVARQNRTDTSTPGAQAQARISAEIKEAQKEIASRAAARNVQDRSGKNIQYNLLDIKDMVSSSIKASMNERRRAKQLSLGGGDAARILAEETRTDSCVGEDEAEDIPMIKPGEASLVASFSCLRPSIDGVDSMLRTAVACAGSTLAIQQSITLQSLMASYNLATLYRDGFRYGKHMWPVELMMYSFIDRTSYIASCTARPRLPQSRSLRPPASMFHPSSIFPTLAQAVIHLTSMTVGVNYGSNLQSAFAEKKKGPIIRSFKTAAQSGKLAKLANAFASQSRSKDQEEEKTGIFGRPPFRPNYETNIVFIFSVLQAAVSSLINHKGKPFYGSILESRPLCLSAGVAVLFAIACMAETFPFINDFLELRRMPSRQSKLTILSIASADVALCVLCRFLSSRLLDASEVQEVLPHSNPDVLAADVEEKLLGEESKQNRNLVLIMLCFMVHMLAEVLLFSG